MKIKTYVINLEESVERKDYVMDETAKYPFMDVELVEAVNGKKMSAAETNSLFDIDHFKHQNLRYPLPAEIGCTLSHRRCYRKLLESEEEYALILEDDVCFLDPANVETILFRIIEKMKKEKACVVTLARHYLYYPLVLYKVNNYAIYRISQAYGTCAYLINRKAARTLLLTPKPFIFADDYEYMNAKGILVHGIYPTLSVGLSETGEIMSEISPLYSYLENSLFLDRLKYNLRDKKRILLRVLGILQLRKIENGVSL